MKNGGRISLFVELTNLICKVVDTAALVWGLVSAFKYTGLGNSAPFVPYEYLTNKLMFPVDIFLTDGLVSRKVPAFVVMI